MLFSPSTLTFLKAAGWSEQRSVDVTDYERALTRRGHEAPAAALTFLSQFGGLHVEHPHHRSPGAQDNFHLDPNIAVERTGIGTVRAFAARAGLPLCPIGEAHRGYMVLMMDPNGTVYAGLDRLLQIVGASGPDAIEALCTGREPLRIP